MAKFRKKPVVIEAVQWIEAPECLDAVEALMAGATDSLTFATDGTGALMIHTLEGVMRADLGDWIIKGIKGEFYPCKPDIFGETYEPAE